MSTGYNWGVNRNTARCTNAVFVVLQCELSEGYGNGDQRCPLGFTAWEGFAFSIRFTCGLL